MFKPSHIQEELESQGNPIYPYELLFLRKTENGKRFKASEDTNPCNVFPDAWRQYWRDTILPGAPAAEKKLNLRMEWPGIWECKEVVLALMQAAGINAFADRTLSAADLEAALLRDTHAQEKLQNRLTLQEYCCFMSRKISEHLDAYARAKNSPKTKSYALDADAVEDPMCHAYPEDHKEDNFEATFDEPYDDCDSFLRITAGEAPDKVFHPLNDDARLQALSF